MAGRKLKLTPELRKEICEYLANGLTKKTAIDACGIAESSFYTWLQRGERDLEAGKNTAYSEFLKDIKKAEAQDKLKRLAIIRKAAQDGTWQAAAWELERRYRDEYGRASMDINLGGQKDAEPIRTESAVQIYLPDNHRNDRGD